MNRQQHDLSAIIAGCKRGDNESFAKLISAYSKRMYGFFFRLSGDKTTSDNLLSELFVKLVEKISTFRGGNFDGWLFTVASNIWHDWLRSKQRRNKALEGHKEHIAQQIKVRQDKQNDVKMFDRLGRELERIDADTKELIVLRYYSQLSFKEIALMRSVPIGTVLSKVHRGLKKLRQQMGRYRDE